MTNKKKDDIIITRKKKGVIEIAVSYNRLWKLLIDKNMKKNQLRKATGIGPSTIAKLGKNGYVSLDVLESICIALGCHIEDIIEFVPDNTKAGE